MMCKNIFFKASIIVVLTCMVVMSWSSVSIASEPPIKDVKLLIEHNSTDRDTGFQGFGDGDPWNQLTISGPGGEPIVTVTPAGGLYDFGLTELFFETSEPENDEVPIEDVLARLPEGVYTFTGDMVDGAPSAMTTPFSHAIPAGPVLLTPADGSMGVDPNTVVVSWEPVSQDINGSPVQIVGYQVIVEEDVPPLYPQGFAQSLFSVYLPPTATNVTVPTAFMENDACYKYEVLAIEESGNQTLASAAFETGAGCEHEDEVEPDSPQIKAAKLLIEHNATDEDTGFQGFGDGDPWNQLTISGPGGEPIVTVTPAGGLSDFGLTELFFETSEPLNDEVPIEDVLARLPEGVYTFTGEMVDGDPSTLTTTFSHTIPAGPVLISPTDDSSNVDPENTVVSWEAVTQDINGAAITIVGYQVIVEKDEDPLYPQGFAQAIFSVYLPPTATSVIVPKEFMEKGASYDYEVLAIEESGNQTLSSATFDTEDVTIEKTQDVGDTVAPGDIFSYTLTVQNYFQDPVEFEIFDALNMNLDYVIGSLVVSENGQGGFVNDVLTFWTDSLDYIDTLTISFQVMVSDLVNYGDSITNMATVSVFSPGAAEPFLTKDSNIVSVEVVPEPSTLIFFGTGLIGLLALVRRSRKARK